MSNGLNYEIQGTTMPLLEFTLNQGQKIISQAGAMKWMSNSVNMETKASGGVTGIFKRVVSGEGIFLVNFTGEKDGDKLAFGHTFPGKIIPWDVSVKPIICQKRAFLCMTEGVELDIHIKKRLSVGFFGGEGFIMQKIHGNGMAFLEVDGEAVEIDLAHGESIKVETSAVAMYEQGVDMSINFVKGLSNIFFGGEGLFLTTLTGPGKVWLQTMPIQSMVAEMSSFLPKPSRK
ncbi:MAG: TIGR00266 family protein [Candidatus Muiribacteriota bacterium]